MSSVVSLGLVFYRGNNKGLEDQMMLSNGMLLSLAHEKMASYMDRIEAITS